MRWQEAKRTILLISMAVLFLLRPGIAVASSPLKIIEVEPSRQDLTLIEKKYINHGKFEKALNLVERIINSNKDDGYAYFIKGLCYHRIAYRELQKYKTTDSAIKHFQVALTNYDTAWKLGFRTAQLYYHRGETKMNTGKNEASLKDLNRSIQINPKRDWVWATRAMAYTKLNKFKLAEADMKKAIELNSGRQTNYGKLAALYDATGQTDKAILALGRAITISPQWSAAYTGRAKLYIKKKQFSKAQADLDRVLALDSDNAEALALRGQLNAKQGQLEQATIDLNEAAQIDRSIKTTATNRKIIDEKTARTLFKNLEAKCLKTIKFNPSDSQLYDLGVAQFGQGKWQECEKTFHRLLSIRGESGDIQLYSAAFSSLALSSMSKREEAAKILKDWMNKKNKASTLARMTIRFLNERSSAQAYFSEAKSKADKTRARFFIGAKLARQNKKLLANRHLTTAIKTGSPELDEYLLSILELKRLNGS